LSTIKAVLYAPHR